MLATVAQRTAAGAFPVRIWRWGSRGFGSPRTIGGARARLERLVGQAQPTTTVALDVDLAGRLHAAWPLTQPSCGGRLCIVYRRTDRNGFGPPIVYPVGPATGDTGERFAVAANSGGSGWLVWDDLSDRVRAVPLVTPPLGSRVGSRRIGRRRVTVPDFYGCVPSGGVFVHRLKVDGRRGAPDPLRALLLRRRPAGAHRPPGAVSDQLHGSLRAGQQARRVGHRPLPPARLAQGANGPRGADLRDVLKGRISGPGGLGPDGPLGALKDEPRRPFTAEPRAT